MGLVLGVSKGGVYGVRKGVPMGLFQFFSTKHELSLLRTELETLKRSFAQIQQEWDATVDRVAKTLRRIRRAEQAREEAEEPEEVQQEPTLPLTTLRPTPDRMQRIREQLAARGKGGE